MKLIIKKKNIFIFNTKYNFLNVKIYSYAFLVSLTILIKYYPYEVNFWIKNIIILDIILEDKDKKRVVKKSNCPLLWYFSETISSVYNNAFRKKLNKKSKAYKDNVNDLWVNSSG